MCPHLFGISVLKYDFILQYLAHLLGQRAGVQHRANIYIVYFLYLSEKILELCRDCLASEKA